MKMTELFFKKQISKESLPLVLILPPVLKTYLWNSHWTVLMAFCKTNKQQQTKLNNGDILEELLQL